MVFITMSHRIYEFYSKGYLLFFQEYCYFVLVLAIITISGSYDVRYVYPFLYGPLIWFSIVNCESYTFNSMNKITSFVLHNFSAIISCLIYANASYEQIWDDLPNNFLHYFEFCMIVLACWYVPLSITFAILQTAWHYYNDCDNKEKFTLGKLANIYKFKETKSTQTLN